METLAALKVLATHQPYNVHYEIEEAARTEYPESHYNIACNLILATLKHGLNFQDYIMVMMSLDVKWSHCHMILEKLINEGKVEKIKTPDNGTILRFKYYKKPNAPALNYKGVNVNKKPKAPTTSFIKRGKR